jgi:hypothetical protein
MTRRRVFLGTLSLSVLVFIGVVVWMTNGSDDDDLDGRATVLRERLGPLCDNFNFQLKEEIAEGLVRPVHCERRGSEEVHVKLYVFSDEDVAEEWQNTRLEEASEDGGVVVGSEDWVAVVLDQAIAEDVRDRLISD